MSGEPLYTLWEHVLKCQTTVTIASAARGLLFHGWTYVSFHKYSCKDSFTLWDHKTSLRQSP